MFLKLKQTLLNQVYSIRLTVMFLFIVLSVLIATVALSLQYYFSQHLAKESANLLFSNSAQRVSDKILSLDVESGDLTLLLSRYPGVQAPDSGRKIRQIARVMAQAMLQKPYLYAVYIGYSNGNLYELINLENSDQLRENLRATASDRWLVVHIHETPEGRKRDSVYLDAQFNPTHRISEPSAYHANVRPWYRDAIKSQTIIKTAPYIFHHSQSPGTTYATRIPESDNVIAVDISLATLSAYLKEIDINKEGGIMVFDRSGKIHAHSFMTQEADDSTDVARLPLTEQQRQYIEKTGVLRVSNEENWPPFDFSYSGQPRGYSVDLLNLLAGKLGLKVKYSNGYSWSELVDLFHQRKLDMLHSLFYNRQRESWGLFSEPYLQLTPVLVTQKNRGQLTTLEQLNHGRVVAIPSGWAFVTLVKAYYPQIQVLEVKDTLAALRAVSYGRADAALDNHRVVKYLIDRYALGDLALHTGLDELASQVDQQLRFLVHSDQPQLRELLNLAIRSVTEQERKKIEAKWLGSSTSALMSRTIGAGVVPDPVFTDLAAMSQIQDETAQHVTIGDTVYTVFVHHIESHLGQESYVGMMVPEAVMQKPYMDKVYYSLVITLGLLMVIAPVLVSFANMIVAPVNLLADENHKIRQRRFKAVKLVPSRIREINDLSHSIVSMAESIESYQLKQEELIDSFIQLIAEAIDEKSPYTGAHCARVPELAMMLATAAEKSDHPAFRHFQFENEEQRREFRIASWLHDCGKVTTPEHIIDKGSKLETIYNRIHEIRMRFEVLWRDAEIQHWQRVVSGVPLAQSEAVMLERHRQIKDDFAFIARCNIGSEFMDDEKVARVERIARQTWMRHLDNRQGLSPQEIRHLSSIPCQPVPATEHLLADTQEHLVPWHILPQEKIPDDIRMDIPARQSNLGEIYNLTIRKGTLTSEDRFRINEHIIATIRMLDSLPLPEDLARIPEIAGGHHEKLDGTGYPKRLTVAELSLEARMLAIADVFEALTASDRPYKEKKKLSQAIAIMAQMVEDQHLDGDLFRLFLSGKLYQQYADRFLEPSQCDEVDIRQYLGGD